MIEALRRVGEQTGLEVLGELVRIAGGPAGRGRGMADGDVVGMPVGSRLIEGEDDARAKLADDFDGSADQPRLGNVFELAVAIVQATYVLDPEGLACAVQFSRSCLPEGAACGASSVSYLPRFATGERYDHRFSAAGDVLCQCPPDTEGLVVRMGK